MITADLSAAAAAAGPGAQNPGVMTITIDLLEFGVPLDLEAPPEDQVGELPVPGAGPTSTVAAA